MKIWFIVGSLLASIATLIWECIEWLRLGYFPKYNLCTLIESKMVCDVSYDGWKGLEIIMNCFFNRIPLFIPFFGLALVLCLIEPSKKSR
jgi:hypothetical protein